MAHLPTTKLTSGQYEAASLSLARHCNVFSCLSPNLLLFIVGITAPIVPTVSLCPAPLRFGEGRSPNENRKRGANGGQDVGWCWPRATEGRWSVQTGRGVAWSSGPQSHPVFWNSVPETDTSVTIPRFQSTIILHHFGNFSQNCVHRSCTWGKELHPGTSITTSQSVWSLNVTAFSFSHMSFHRLTF